MKINCAICEKNIKNKITKWSHFCRDCDYWGADLQPNIVDVMDPIFDESRGDDNVISFLDSIRVDNFNKILSYVDANIGSNKRILDVGCASGLFMELAIQNGHVVIGVEPNPLMYSAAINRKLEVINGYFPNDININLKFDIIIFNDVFEHIPDVNSILSSCYKHLVDGGILIINIPNSNGLIFKISKLLARFNLYGPWNRLWQTMFYTPHLHYFNPASLALLTKKHSFKIKINGYQLESFSLKGLWKRISIDSSNSLMDNCITYIGTIAIYPFIKIFPRDSFFSVYIK